MSFQVEDDDTLPPSEKHHPFDTEEFTQWVPVDGMPQLLVDSMKQLDQAIQCIHHGTIENKRQIRICNVPFKATFSVDVHELKDERQKGGYGLDHNILQDSMFTLQHELCAKLPGLKYEIQ
jgi:hypothetical protein